MRYRFRELSFDVADGLSDQSMVVLVDDEKTALTVAREPKEGTLVRYVEDALAELATTLTGHRLVSREEQTVAGLPAVVLVQAALSPEGRAVTQRQAYLELGGDVVVVTVTSPAEHAALGRGHFDRALASLAVG
jgi:hypothetical protein